jgi:hypothetical protein
MFRRTFLVALALLPLLATGCGRPPTGTVSGKVTVKGKDPLPGGSIVFYSVADPKLMAGGVINADGTYSVNGVPVGECKVVIDNSNLDSSGKSGAQAGTPGGPPEPLGRPVTPPKSLTEGGVKKYVKIDPSFTKLESTPLKHTVTTGDNKDVNFDVK